MTILNTLLYDLFSAGQIAVIVLVCVLVAVAIGLNIWLIYLLHKKGEHRMHTAELQKQRDALLGKLDAMTTGKDIQLSGDIASKFNFAVVSTDDLGRITVDDDDERFVKDEADDDEFDEETEVLDVEVNEEGKVVRYNRSFTARIIQSNNDLKGRYSELKNYIMAYKAVKARMSWKKETFHIGRKNLVSFVIRGKTLCVCLATDPKMFDGTKYKVDDLSLRNPKNPMPCMFRITSDRKTAYAKELIEIVMAGIGVSQVDTYTPDDFTLPYKSTPALIKRRLIKIVGTALPDFVKEDALAAAKRIRYNRSFEARIIQSDDEMNGYYSVLKNYLLSYENVIDKLTWKKESYYHSKTLVATFVIKGKTLCLCLALDPTHFADSKYKVENLAARVAKTNTPLLYRIKNARRLQYAKDLIDIALAGLGSEKTQREDVNYVVPFVATDNLIRRGLIKEVAIKVTEKSNPNIENAIKELPKRQFKTVHEVAATQVAEIMTDAQAEELIEDVEVKARKYEGKKKGTINVSTLSKNYQPGDKVTVESLHIKGLIPDEVGRLKVLADGILDKPLIVEADDFSVEAVKMIVLTGGRVIRSHTVKK